MNVNALSLSSLSLSLPNPLHDHANSAPAKIKVWGKKLSGVEWSGVEWSRGVESVLYNTENFQNNLTLCHWSMQ